MIDAALSTHPSRRGMSGWMRQFHRWVSVAFVLSVVATTVAMSQPQPLIWVSYVPLAPLFLLFVTGTYLFALPHLSRWRRGRV
jgi:apolipoprotein N-acyltransferase